MHTSASQQTFCTDSLVQDFRYFVEQLEQTHPDPYTRYGGKASFHKAVETCAMHYENADSQLQLPTENMGYALLDEEGKTRYFRASAMYARDNIEYEYKNSMSTFADDLNYCYSLVHADKPDSTEEAIAQ